MLVNRTEQGLTDAILKYTTSEHTPELVHETWQTIWSVWTGRIGYSSILVPPFPGNSQSIRRHETLGDKPIYVPDFFASSPGQYVLNSIFPQMHNFTFQDGQPVKTDRNRILNYHSGWRYVEASAETPYKNTSVMELMEGFGALHREGMTPVEYIIASQECFLETGQYFDSEGYISRLLGSNIQGRRYLRAWFTPEGDFYTFLDINPTNKEKYGGRSSVRVKST